MTRTGWGEDPDGAPALPVTAMLLAQPASARAGTLETALARSRAADAREAREEAARAPDPDERAAAFVTRGYMPGLVPELSQRLGDMQAELQAEQAKIEQGAAPGGAVSPGARGRPDHGACHRAMDFGEGDPDRAALERRAALCRRSSVRRSGHLAAAAAWPGSARGG